MSTVANTAATRVLVVLGNDESWGETTPLFDAQPGDAVRISMTARLLPRPARLTVGGREVLALAGAASVDRARRIE
ncbi:hypothetical protein J7E68_09885 [Microbacterium sp. ISL-103]|uniref:hypothetical protein n=1 Tax=Microbacterium sp. ISL-103 TaxID=2819156 RepID=UPI001BE5E427|nr:hypothetical protein [Microbacterium sp. ISL-103]MBT2474870.1 hypothetical protein [Microbacterium sp. ISL-103]